MQIAALVILVGWFLLVEADDVVFIEEHYPAVIVGADLKWGYVQYTPRQCLELCQSDPTVFAQTKSFDHFRKKDCYCNSETYGGSIAVTTTDKNWYMYTLNDKLTGVKIFDVDSNAFLTSDMRNLHFSKTNATVTRYVFIAEGTAIPPASRRPVRTSVECGVLCSDEQDKCNLFVVENVNGKKYCSTFFNMY